MMTGSFFEMGSWGDFRGVTWSVLKATPMLRSWGGRTGQKQGDFEEVRDDAETKQQWMS